MSHTKVLIFVFNLLKYQTPGSLQSELSPFLKESGERTRRHSLYLVSLILMIVDKCMRRLYQRNRQRSLQEYALLPRETWKNDYPIVLVHGFGGWAPDETLVMGDYFQYASNQAIRGSNEVYHADVSPFGSMHDRACELYQQLIGIFKF
jgi:hypothetical protein